VRLATSISFFIDSNAFEAIFPYRTASAQHPLLSVCPLYCYLVECNKIPMGEREPAKHLKNSPEARAVHSWEP
jgi:hypothetical protein